MGKKLKDEVTKDWLFGFIKKEQRIEHMQKGGSLLLATPNVLERLGPATRSEGGSDGTRTQSSAATALARWPRHSSSCRSAAQLADLLYV